MIPWFLGVAVLLGLILLLWGQPYIDRLYRQLWKMQKTVMIIVTLVSLCLSIIYYKRDHRTSLAPLVLITFVVFDITFVVFDITFVVFDITFVVFDITLVAVRTGSPKSWRAVSETTKKLVAARQQWKCGRCQRVLDETYEVDHVIPLHQGGTNHPDNLMALDPICHRKKTKQDGSLSYVT